MIIYERGSTSCGIHGVESFARNNPARVLEPIRRQRRVDGGAAVRPMVEPALDRPGVVTLVGGRVVAGVRACESGLQLIPLPYQNDLTM
jgi:hypothetical protein